MNKQYEALIKNDEKIYTTLANTSAYIFENFKLLNWVGFYLNENETLYLHAFQGKVACTKIPFNRGVCGFACRIKQTVVVGDVHQFEDHIACDSASQSEIVIPIIINNQLFGVLDIDSPITYRFSEEDQKQLEEIVNILEKKLETLL
ncbi:GAF domain-containing protein [[Mycoplasma] anseris]|nr:GAF domain-containing protein [[Mycoplasma] anseris]